MKENKKIQLANNRGDVQIKKIVNKTLGRQKIIEKRYNRENGDKCEEQQKIQKKKSKSQKRKKKELKKQ